MSVLLAVKVFPSAIVRVALVAGAVRATLFIEVAVATPISGVVNDGEVVKAIDPDPLVVSQKYPPVVEILVSINDPDAAIFFDIKSFQILPPFRRALNKFCRACLILPLPAG